MQTNPDVIPVDAVRLASLGFKISGVYAVVQAILLLQPVPSLVAQILAPAAESGPPRFAAVLLLNVLVPAGLLVVLGWALVFRSDRYARSLFLASPQVDTQPAASALDLQTIGIAVVGLWVLALALPQLVSVGAQLFWSSLSPVYWYKTRFDQWARLAQLGTQLALGGVLFFASRSIARVWQRLQA